MNNRTPLQSHRRAVGLSQEDVADACMVAVSTVRRWEAGEVLPQPKHRQQLAATLELTPVELDRILEAGRAANGRPLQVLRTGVPGYDPEVTAPDPALAALEWILDANGPLLGLTSPAGHRTRRFGQDLVDQVASRVVRWRRADDTTPTWVLLPEMLEEVTRLETVLRHHNYSELVGRRLHGPMAEVLQLAGWLSIDQGRRKTGERCYREDLLAARIAGDRALAAQMLSCDAYQRASRGEDALLLAQAALHCAGEVAAGAHPVPGASRLGGSADGERARVPPRAR